MPLFPVQSTESQRIERILTSPEAKGRENQAQHLAFRTNQTADAAIATLKASGTAGGAPAGTGFDAAMKAKGIDAGAMYAQRAAESAAGAGSPGRRRTSEADGQARQQAPSLDAGAIYAGRRSSMGQS